MAGTTDGAHKRGRRRLGRKRCRRMRSRRQYRHQHSEKWHSSWTAFVLVYQLASPLRPAPRAVLHKRFNRLSLLAVPNLFVPRRTEEDMSGFSATFIMGKKFSEPLAKVGGGSNQSERFTDVIYATRRPSDIGISDAINNTCMHVNGPATRLLEASVLPASQQLWTRP